MAAIETEAAQTDPAATSIENDQTIPNQAENMKEEQGQSAEVVEAAGSAPAQDEPVKSEEAAKIDDTTKPEEAPPVNGDSKSEKPAERSQRNGDDNERRRFTKPRRNVKTDFSAQPESSDPEEIRKQVEFYFSDSNLIQDKFLLDLVGGHENRSVPIKVIHSFKRMRHFQPYSAVVTALHESEVLEVTADEEIRRKAPLPEDVGKEVNEEKIKTFEDKAMPRSIYAKGFGEEGPSTQFDIEAFFMPYGPTNQIRLRRTWNDKTFKGSVFVEFDSEETQKAFLALDPKPKFQGKELKIMSKKDYVESKAEDIRTGKIQASERPQYSKNNRGRGRGGGRGGRNDRNGGRRDRSRSPRGDRNEKDWKGRREDFQKSRDFRGRGGKYARRGRDDDRGEKRRRDDAGDKEEKNEENPEAKKTKVETSEPAKGAEVPPEVAKPEEKPAAVEDSVPTAAAAS